MKQKSSFYKISENKETVVRVRCKLCDCLIGLWRGMDLKDYEKGRLFRYDKKSLEGHMAMDHPFEWSVAERKL